MTVQIHNRKKVTFYRSIFSSFMYIDTPKNSYKVYYQEQNQEWSVSACRRGSRRTIHCTGPLDEIDAIIARRMLRSGGAFSLYDCGELHGIPLPRTVALLLAQELAP